MLSCLNLSLFSFLRYVHLDPLWADFQGTPSTGSRPIPFVDALPASLWLYKQPEENQAPKTPSSATSLKQPPPLPKRSKAPAGPSRQTSKTGKNILFCQMVFLACFFSLKNIHFHFNWSLILELVSVRITLDLCCLSNNVIK